MSDEIDTLQVEEIPPQENGEPTLGEPQIEKVLNSQEKMNAANYFKIQAEERKIWEEARKQ